ncbi:hypothetical protein Plhal304r1_c080g0165861 [Plasmopara halstedii]
MTIVPTLLNLLELMLQITVTPKAPCTKSMTKACGRDALKSTKFMCLKISTIQDQLKIDSRLTTTCMSCAARTCPQSISISTYLNSFFKSTI